MLSRIDPVALYGKLQEHKCTLLKRNGYKLCFRIEEESASYIVRAIQEIEILKTKKYKGRILLKSFAEAWVQNQSLRKQIIASSDPYEEMWRQSRRYGYKMATTYMPEYAKSIYEYFAPEIVLDPCAGWGDRMMAASTVSTIQQYIGFDPNEQLRAGYIEIMNLSGAQHIGDNPLAFSNQYLIHSIPFEHNQLESNSVDLVFTSPPFFDYEIYNSTNPQYSNWIDEFYIPLFRESCRCVKPNKYVVMYIENTCCGNIDKFLTTQVETVCDLTLQFKIGCERITDYNSPMRTVWCYQKGDAAKGHAVPFNPWLSEAMP